jgi:hypothetical protein
MADKGRLQKATQLIGAGSSIVACAMLSGCVSPPVRTIALSSPPITSARTYVYPAQGQSPEPLERERYECYRSAVQQTGIDPSRPTRSYDQVAVAPALGPAPQPAQSVGPFSDRCWPVRVPQVWD